MTLEELGAALRTEREKRDISIDDVAKQLKIAPGQLRALESGDISQLPHPSYAKGFFKSYAAFLGLDATQVQEAFVGMQPQPLKKPVTEGEGFYSNAAPVRGHGGKFIAFALICLLCAGGYYVWRQGYFDYDKKSIAKNSTIQEKLPGVSSRITPKAGERADIQSENNLQRLPGADVLNLQPVTVPTITGNEPAPGGNISDSGNSAGLGTANVNDQSEAVLPVGQHRLVINATAECWVQTLADRTETRQFSLRKGDSHTVNFANSLELKLGNAGGVQLQYDGNELPPSGTSGQVKTLYFPEKIQ